MIDNNLTNDIDNNLTNKFNKMDKIQKSWINFIGKEYIDTPIMNQYLQFKENDNHLNGLNLLNQIM